MIPPLFRKLSLCLLLGVLGLGAASAQAQQRGPLVLAASSLQEALSEAASA